QHLGQQPVGQGNSTVIAGEPGRYLGNRTHVIGVVVAPGQEARPAGRTKGCRVEVVVTQAPCGQLVQVRRLDDRRTVALQRRKTHVVEHDVQDVRGALWGGRLRAPVGGGLTDGPADLALESRLVRGRYHRSAVRASRRREDAARFNLARLSPTGLGLF